MTCPERTAAQQADEYARTARRRWTGGDLPAAAVWNRAASLMDPSRAESCWTPRADALLADASRQPLAVQTAVRLAVAGLGPDDPGVAHVRECNALAAAKAPAWTRQAEREAGS